MFPGHKLSARLGKCQASRRLHCLGDIFLYTDTICLGGSTGCFHSSRSGGELRLLLPGFGVVPFRWVWHGHAMAVCHALPPGIEHLPRHFLSAWKSCWSVSDPIFCPLCRWVVQFPILELQRLFAYFGSLFLLAPSFENAFSTRAVLGDCL